MSAPCRHRESLAFVEQAIAELPSMLAEALDVELPAGLAGRVAVATGIGASEGPARLFAARLAASGRPARFASISELTSGSLRGELLVVFSQGLSPNARLALRDETAFVERVLVTSIGYQDARDPRRAMLARFVARGLRTIVVPPTSEQGTLARMRGPTVASLIALRLAGELGAAGCSRAELSEAPSIYARASATAPTLGDASTRPIALVTAGISADEAFGARWKLLETLLVPDPPTWDALAFAHGPSQAMHGRPLTLIAFETPRGRTLVDRLAESIDPSHHRLVRLVATTDGPLAVLQHLAMLDAALVATLREHPRDLFDWPSRGTECALYALGEDVT